MLKLIKGALLTAGIWALAAVGPVLADDLVLVITNGDYGNGISSRSVTRRHAALIDAYGAEGYEIIDGRNLDADSMREAFESFYNRARDKDRLVVHYSGHAVNAMGQSWLLPVDVKPDALFGVAYAAPSLDMVLGILGQKPGRGVMIFADYTEDRAVAPLVTGLGGAKIPQGVLLLSGAEEDVNDFVLGGFLTSIHPLAVTLADSRADLEIAGFVSPDISLAKAVAVEESTGPSPANWVDIVAEQALWAVADKSNRKEDLEEYLRKFPNGMFATLARQRLEALSTTSVAPTPADIENALGLTRTQKREIQADLTLLGYNTRGIDGIFGQGTRTAISAWQGAARYPVTGYLTATQLSSLRAQADARREAVQAEDRRYWNATGISGRKNDLEQYLARYPDGLFAEQARAALAAFEAAERERADQAAWRVALSQNTAESYRAYLAAFPEGIYADIAVERLRELDPHRLTPAELAAAVAQESRLNLNTATRILIENRLKSLGFDPGPTDGIFDATTREAIRTYQESKGLAATGYIDPATVRALLLG